VGCVIGGSACPILFGGLEQFARRGDSGDIGYCIAGATPYALEFHNDSDVVCLLLGDIAGEARFDDDRLKPLVFAGQSAAFHPAGGRVRVRALNVRHGFIAFSYPSRFKDGFDDRTPAALGETGSRNNIRKDTIRSLATYALRRLRSEAPLAPLETQSLASLVYLETMRCLGVFPEERRSRLSDREFNAVCAFIEAELGGELTCAQLATAAGVPLRVVFEGMKIRTGMTPYRFVIERRIARAQEMLLSTRTPISEIALACGFSSQQHLTSAFSSRLGKTPHQLRMQRCPAEVGAGR
jgi:AraC family transcriptional regulator